MNTQEKMNNMLDELYRHSTPPITWKEIQETYADDENSKFYDKHIIGIDDYSDIVGKHLRRMTKLEQHNSSFVLLRFAPRCNYDQKLPTFSKTTPTS